MALQYKLLLLVHLTKLTICYLQAQFKLEKEGLICTLCMELGYGKVILVGGRICWFSKFVLQNERRKQKKIYSTCCKHETLFSIVDERCLKTTEESVNAEKLFNF